MTSKANAESNIREFLEEHGKEGFLKLLLTNYLFELVMYYLHTRKNPATGVKEDTGYRFYVNGREQVYSPKEIERFKHDLHVECKRKAALIVGILRETNLIEKLTDDVMAEPKVIELVQEAFERIMKTR